MSKLGVSYKNMTLFYKLYCFGVAVLVYHYYYYYYYY